MRKIDSYIRQNSLATALREMGRIEKTNAALNKKNRQSLGGNSGRACRRAVDGVNVSFVFHYSKMSVTAPLDAEETNLAYLASTPEFTFSGGCIHA